ncbi:MAG: DUF1366 domain-containing protein [Streptococcus lutetiensis]
MRAWYVVGKYPIYTDGEITHTEITLATMSGSYGTFTERVIGDQTSKTNDELIKLARDAYFKSEYADKAMPEAVQKVDELSKKTAEYEETIDQMQAAIDKSEKMTQLATATLNELINKMYPDEGTTDGATEGTTDETTKEN